MEFPVSISSAGVFGGNPTYSLAGQYLQRGLGDYGGAVADIEVTACFRGGRVRDQYHTEFLPSLPLVKFLRKKRRVLLSYETAVADAKFLGRSGPPVAEVFAPALAELAGQAPPDRPADQAVGRLRPRPLPRRRRTARGRPFAGPPQPAREAARSSVTATMIEA